MENKPGEFVFTDDDGKEWVTYEYFKTVDKIALENKLIVEHIQQLLGVYTTTGALVKIVELQNQQSAQQGVHPTGLNVAQKEEVRQMIQSALDTGSA